MGRSVGGMEPLGDDHPLTDEDGPHQGAIADPAATTGGEVQTPAHELWIDHAGIIDDPGKRQYHCFTTVVF